MIPGDYAGVMGTDRGKSYDAKEFDAVAQQKCLSHLQRNLTEVLETKKGRAREFGLGLKDMLRLSIELYHKRSDLPPADYQLQAQEIDDALTFHLRHRILKDDHNQRLLDGIGIHQDRGNLLRFLRVEGFEPTNNRAERALRPAVIARKVSHCSKNQRGAGGFRGFRQCDSDGHSGGRSIHHRLPAESLLDSGVAIRLILLGSRPNHSRKLSLRSKPKEGSISSRGFAYGSAAANQLQREIRPRVQHEQQRHGGALPAQERRSRQEDDHR